MSIANPSPCTFATPSGSAQLGRTSQFRVEGGEVWNTARRRPRGLRRWNGGGGFPTSPDLANNSERTLARAIRPSLVNLLSLPTQLVRAYPPKKFWQESCDAGK